MPFLHAHHFNYPRSSTPKAELRMQTKKKVIFLHHSLRQSGAVRQLLYLFHGLDRKQFEPIMIVQHKDKVSNPRILSDHKFYFLKENNENIIQLFFKFISIIKKEKPLCIQTFNRRSNWVAYLASLFYDSPPVFGSVRASKLKFKWLLAEGTLQNQYKQVIVNSVATKEVLIKKALVKKDKIKLIYNGLDTELFAPYSADKAASLRGFHKLDSDTLAILSVGRIHWIKNLLCTIKALARLRDRKLKFQYFCIGAVQDKKYNEELMACVREHHLEEVCHFVGPTDRISDYYNFCDVMILSSFFEGLPNVVIEAMACESIAVVADSADNDGVVTDGINGFKFKGNNETELADTLTRIVSLSDSERSRIKANARLTTLRRFSLDRMVKEFESLYLHCD